LVQESTTSRSKAKAKGKMQPVELLEKAMPEAGLVQSNLFILMNNEYWEDYDPWHNLLYLFGQYYGDDDNYSTFEDCLIARKNDGFNSSDFADEIGVELPEDDEEDDEY
jgi:hypothetical protein